MQNPKIPTTLLLLSLLSSLLLLSGASAPIRADFTIGDGKSVFADPEWQKRFLGSYGFLSGVEPEIANTELELLREIIELMKANPQAAMTRLRAEVGANSSAAIDFILANLEFQTGELDAAIGHYESALEKFPDFRRAHKNLGLLRVQRGEFPKALEHLSRAVELGDRDGRNFGLMGYCYVQVGNYLAAEQAYRSAILQEPDTRDWKDGLARSLLAMEKYREAASLFGSLIDENPEDTTAWLLQANAWIGLEEHEKAAVNLEAVRALGKADANHLVLLGDIYMNEGATGLARDAYLAAIQLDSDGKHFRAAVGAADLLIRASALDEAAAVLDSIDTRYRKNLVGDQKLEVLTLQAKLARAQGRESEAAKLLESIVAEDGTRGDALLELAAYHRSQGDNERALLYIERAERLSSHRYAALLERAQLMVATRDYASAAESLREALSIKNEPRVARFLARVEQAAGS